MPTFIKLRDKDKAQSVGRTQKSAPDVAKQRYVEGQGQRAGEATKASGSARQPSQARDLRSTRSRQVQEATKDRKQMQVQVAASKFELDAVRDQLRESEAERHQMAALIVQAREEQRYLEEQRHMIMSETEHAHTALGRVQKELPVVGDAHEGLRSEAVALEGQLSVAKRVRSLMVNQTASACKEIAAFNRKSMLAKHEVKKMSAEWSLIFNEMRHSEVCFVKLQDAIECLDEQILAKQDDAATLRNEAVGQKDQQRFLAKQIALTEGELQKMQENIQAVGKQRNALQKKASRIGGMQKRCQKQLSEATSDLDRLDSHSQNIGGNLHDLELHMDLMDLPQDNGLPEDMSRRAVECGYSDADWSDGDEHFSDDDRKRADIIHFLWSSHQDRRLSEASSTSRLTQKAASKERRASSVSSSTSKASVAVPPLRHHRQQEDSDADWRHNDPASHWDLDAASGSAFGRRPSCDEVRSTASKDRRMSSASSASRVESQVVPVHDDDLGVEWSLNGSNDLGSDWDVEADSITTACTRRRACDDVKSVTCKENASPTFSLNCEALSDDSDWEVDAAATTVPSTRRGSFSDPGFAEINDKQAATSARLAEESVPLLSRSTWIRPNQQAIQRGSPACGVPRTRS